MSEYQYIPAQPGYYVEYQQDDWAEGQHLTQPIIAWRLDLDREGRARDIDVVTLNIDTEGRPELGVTFDDLFDNEKEWPGTMRVVHRP